MPIISSEEFMVVMPTVVLLLGYHLHLFWQVRRYPLTTAIGITNHAREMWVSMVMEENRDILAVQTMRNQVMAATFLASTAILISLGAISSAFRPDVFSELSHELNVLGGRSQGLFMFKLMLLSVLFFVTFFNFTLAVRYYNHAGFMINTVHKNDPSVSAQSVTKVLNQGALHYTIGMRGFYLSVPLALWLFGPIWIAGGCILLLPVLYHLDRKA